MKAIVVLQFTETDVEGRAGGVLHPQTSSIMLVSGTDVISCYQDCGSSGKFTLFKVKTTIHEKNEGNREKKKGYPNIKNWKLLALLKNARRLTPTKKGNIFSISLNNPLVLKHTLTVFSFESPYHGLFTVLICGLANLDSEPLQNGTTRNFHQT